MAVIAGFLLTAVRNWTGLPTPQGGPLASLFGLWAGARLLYLGGTRFIGAAACLDVLFIVCLNAAILSRLIRARQWRQTAIGAKLLFLMIGNITFYLGITGRLEQGIYWGLYGGLYLIISLIMTMGARIIPAFVQNGVGYDVKLANPLWINIASLLLFLFFFIAELFVRRPALTAMAASGLFVVTSLRLIGWHTPGIWRKPLLWSLYLSFVFIDVGFLLFALSPFLRFSRLIAIHAMTVGGIGLITMGMMARVSLGHSGRNIHSPPRVVAYSLAGLVLAVIDRVLFPLIWPASYVTWIAIAQGIWVVSFVLFAISYMPIWCKSGVGKS
jgi:uncharacterized protein involved in response to NO